MKPINVRQKAIPFVPARYIQTFDVISEVNCLLLRKKWRFEIIVLFCCNTQNRGGKYPSSQQASCSSFFDFTPLYICLLESVYVTILG